MHRPARQRELQRHLVRLTWQRRWRMFLGCFVALAAAGALGYFYELERKTPVAVVVGSVVGLQETQTNDAPVTLFVVHLADGREVIVGETARLTYRAGARIELQEYRSGLLGRASFRFRRYLDRE